MSLFEDAVINFSVVRSTELMNSIIVLNGIQESNFALQLAQSNIFIVIFFVKVDEAIQTTGHEVIAAPGDLWDTRPASAEYWYKKKGKGKLCRY